jgi:hypothetical protein
VEYSTIYQLFINFKEAYDSVRREVLYNTLTEFGIPRNYLGQLKCVQMKPTVESV